jgi:prolyl-tRNA synthetase
MIEEFIIPHKTGILYTPLGMKILNRIIYISKEHINKISFSEVLLPSLVDEEIYDMSLRKQFLEKEFLKTKKYILSPTHEEIICSHKKSLPDYMYQISRKYRDEKVIPFLTGKEFLMLDAYSFDDSTENARQTYAKLRTCFCEILSELNIKFMFGKKKVSPLFKDESEEIIVEINGKEIEICHIFLLFDFYTKSYGIKKSNEFMKMGSYGLGLDRIAYCIITKLCENHDKKNGEDLVEKWLKESEQI